jgi:hypothetical protein
MAIWQKVITAADDSDYKNSSVTVADLGGGSGSTFLKKDGTWATPTDTNTQLTTEAVQDIVGAMFSGNTETRITATYQDGDGTLDLVVDDMNDTTPTGDSGNAAVYDNSGTPALKTGITAAEMRTVIDAHQAIDSGNRLSATLVGGNGNVSNTEYGYLNGVTSGIQQQLDQRAAINGDTLEDFSAKDMEITGNLTVTGTIDTVSQTNSNLVDKTITLSVGATTEAASDGSGIVINTGQTIEPKLYWYDDTVSTNVDGRIGTGWMVATTGEAQSAANDYHLMGFKTGNGVPSVATKAVGEGTFYWDNSADTLYVCTSSYTNTGGG